MSIPKVIWQTHNYEYDDLPLHFKKVSYTWQNLNPDWEYRFVSHIEREDIIKKYPTLWKYYPTQDAVCQADMWRYVVTYEHGGVYADMDSICTKPITYLLDSLEDFEIIVPPAILWQTTLKDVVNKLKSKNISDDEIDFRIRMQRNRSGVTFSELGSETIISGSTTKSSNYAVKKHSTIMKKIIEESENHFIKNISETIPAVKLYIPYLNIMHGLENDPRVSFKFDAFHHDDLYKTDFDSNFIVDDYGTEVAYEDYLKKYSLSMC